jgi:hypothetical protein
MLGPLYRLCLTYLIGAVSIALRTHSTMSSDLTLQVWTVTVVGKGSASSSGDVVELVDALYIRWRKLETPFDMHF